MNIAAPAVIQSQAAKEREKVGELAWSFIADVYTIDSDYETPQNDMNMTYDCIALGPIVSRICVLALHILPKWSLSFSLSV